MNVGGHQAITPYTYPIMFTGFLKITDINLPVLITKKHIKTAVTALDHMMRISGYYYP